MQAATVEPRQVRITPLAIFAARRDFFTVSASEDFSPRKILDELFLGLPLEKHGWKRRWATAKHMGRGIWRIERY